MNYVAEDRGYLVAMFDRESSRVVQFGFTTINIQDVQFTKSAVETIENMSVDLDPSAEVCIEKDEKDNIVLCILGQGRSILNANLSNVYFGIPKSRALYAIRKQIVSDDKVEIPIEAISAISEMESFDVEEME